VLGLFSKYFFAHAYYFAENLVHIVFLNARARLLANIAGSTPLDFFVLNVDLFCCVPGLLCAFDKPIAERIRIVVLFAGLTTVSKLFSSVKPQSYLI
jgi:hypothetical protein